MSRHARSTLERLLQELSEHPEHAADIEARIRKRFERECATLCLDLSGFTRLTIRHGAVNFLVRVHRMRQLARPIVTQHGGRVFKEDADNLFALYDEVAPAVASAVAMQQAFAAINTTLPEEADLHAAIGIGFGRNLVIGDEDVHGGEMNLCCKLGEDLARQGEILLTRAARERVAQGPWSFRPILFSIAGLEFEAFALDSSPT